MSVTFVACNTSIPAPVTTSVADAGAQQFHLDVTRSGSGTIVSTPAGINCGVTCGADFGTGTAVSLAATAAAGQQFSGWGGDCSGNAACVVTMNQARHVTAAFAALPATPHFHLSVTRTGPGTVTSTPAGIACGASCGADFDQDTQVTLAAAADSGARFTGWSGDCSGSTSCVVGMSQARNVAAAYSLLPPPAPVGAWLKGDTHVHNDHSADGSGPRQAIDQGSPGNVSIADQIGQGVLHGLDWMPLTDHRTYDQHYDPLWESSSLLLVPGEEANSSPHSTVHGAVDWIVQGASRPGAPDFDRLQTSVWDAHAQGANWSIAHPDDGELQDDGVTVNDRASAIGMDLVETWNRGSNTVKEVAYAEDRWNHGWRFGMTGASDNHFRELWAVAGPAMPITGVFATEASERAIVQGLQAGRTRVALDPDPVAPHVTLEADFQGDGIYEAMCGDEVIAPAGTAGKLRIRVDNAIGDSVLLYKSPGIAAGPLQSFSVTGLAAEFLVNVTVEAAPTWYRVEVRGLGQPASVDTNALKAGDPTPVLTPNLVSNEMRAVCSPIFVSSAPATPQAEKPLPADSGIDDGAQLAMGAAGKFSGFPDVAVAGGLVHVVAESHGDGATHVLYRHAGAGGALSAAQDLAPASKSARFPKIAARGSDVWVTWQDERAGQVPHRQAIYLRHSADGGSTWLAEQKLRDIAGRAQHPVLALMPDGKPVVVWQEISAANPFDVMAQVVGADAAPVNLSRAGKTVTAANLYDTRSAVYPASVWPSVAVAPDGRIAVAFQDDRTDPDPLWTGHISVGDTTDVDNWQVLVMLRPSGSNSWNAPVSLGADDRADRHPAIAFAEDGALVTAWDSVCLNASGCNVAVLSARSTDNGAHWAASQTIATATVGMSQYPKLGNDPSGAVRAVWYDSRSDDWRWRVMTAVHDALGNWMSVQLVPSRGVNTWPATSSGAIVFASTRNAQRLQRDRTQQIFLLAAP